MGRTSGGENIWRRLQVRAGERGTDLCKVQTARKTKLFSVASPAGDVTGDKGKHIPVLGCPACPRPRPRAGPAVRVRVPGQELRAAAEPPHAGERDEAPAGIPGGNRGLGTNILQKEGIGVRSSLGNAGWVLCGKPRLVFRNNGGMVVWGGCLQISRCWTALPVPQNPCGVGGGREGG